MAAAVLPTGSECIKSKLQTGVMVTATSESRSASAPTADKVPHEMDAFNLIPAITGSCIESGFGSFMVCYHIL
jgi:hypothetical protein